LADYAAEKSFVLALPHRFLMGKPEQMAAQNPLSTRKRRPGSGVRAIAHFEKSQNPTAFFRD
jgi:hypothetical protein